MLAISIVAKKMRWICKRQAFAVRTDAKPALGGA
jgi:hypothetical protein